MEAGFETESEWITPIDAVELIKGSGLSPYECRERIAKRAAAELVQAMAKTAVFSRGTDRKTKSDFPIWAGFWTSGGGEYLSAAFWQSGDFTGYPFATDPSMTVNFFDIVFRRDDIAAMIQTPTISPPSLQDAEKVIDAGGRPAASSHGDAIAAVTLRLASLNLSELKAYSGAAVGAELAAEYAKLDERPPHERNLDKYGAGILRVLRERKT